VFRFGADPGTGIAGSSEAGSGSGDRGVYLGQGKANGKVMSSSA
jgi:hypothetical protein